MHVIDPTKWAVCASEIFLGYQIFIYWSKAASIVLFSFSAFQSKLFFFCFFLQWMVTETINYLSRNSEKHLKAQRETRRLIHIIRLITVVHKLLTAQWVTLSRKTQIQRENQFSMNPGSPHKKACSYASVNSGRRVLSRNDETISSYFTLDLMLIK